MHNEYQTGEEELPNLEELETKADDEANHLYDASKNN